MLIPQEVALNVYRGGTFEQVFELYENIAKKERYNLTGFKVEVVIANLVTLTEGSGVTIISKTEGKLEIVLTATQTAEILKNEEREYKVKITKESGGQIWYPVFGPMKFQLP